MQGLYASPDVCLQVVSVWASDRWRVFGVQEDEGEFYEWYCDIRKYEGEEGASYRVEDTSLTSLKKDAVVLVSDDAIEWPDGTTWRRLVCSHTQLSLMRPPRAFYTPMALYCCMALYRFFASRLALGVDCIRSFRKKKAA